MGSLRDLIHGLDWPSRVGLSGLGTWTAPDVDEKGRGAKVTTIVGLEVNEEMM